MMIGEGNANFDVFEYVRGDPEMVAISRAEAEAFIRLDHSVKAHLFSHGPDHLQYLLPEHRELVLRSIEGYERADEVPQPAVPSNVLSDAGMRSPVAGVTLSRADHARILGETLVELERRGSQLRTQLQQAVDRADRRELNALITSNIWEEWFLSHILEPFLEETASALQALGVDPETIRAQARSHARFRNGPQRDQAIDPDLSVSLEPPALPSPVPERPMRETIEAYGLPMDCAKIVALINAAMPSPSESANDVLVQQYFTLQPLWDALEHAVSEDLGGRAFPVLGLVENGFSEQAQHHPLCAAFAAASRRRLQLAEAIAAREGVSDLARREAGPYTVRLEQDWATVAATSGGPPTAAPAPPALPPPQPLAPAADHPGPRERPAPAAPAPIPSDQPRLPAPAPDTAAASSPSPSAPLPPSVPTAVTASRTMDGAPPSPPEARAAPPSSSGSKTEAVAVHGTVQASPPVVAPPLPPRRSPTSAAPETTLVADPSLRSLSTSGAKTKAPGAARPDSDWARLMRRLRSRRPRSKPKVRTEPSARAQRRAIRDYQRELEGGRGPARGFLITLGITAAGLIGFGFWLHANDVQSLQATSAQAKRYRMAYIKVPMAPAFPAESLACTMSYVPGVTPMLVTGRGYVVTEQREAAIAVVHRDPKGEVQIGWVCPAWVEVVDGELK